MSAASLDAPPPSEVPAASKSNLVSRAQRSVGDSRVRFGIIVATSTEIDVTGFFYTDHEFRSVQIHARSAGIGCNFSGTPEQARELALALVKAADAVDAAAPNFSQPTLFAAGRI